LNAYDPQSFDPLAEEYDFVATRERTPSFFLEHFPERRQQALDVGCGTGILAQELSRHFASVAAVDISEPMLAIAPAKRSAANIDYRREDADHLVLAQTFDFVVSHTTFHHLKDVSNTLCVLKAALEPGGHLVFIDNVCRFPVIPRNAYTFTAKASLKLPRDLLRYGPRSASRLFRFRTSRLWLDHVKSDKILTRTQFREVYTEILPGALFIPMKYFMGVVWQASRTRPA
jgi:2-polyprenyl-3-methyl-5-hydroxy-6-metoxy-1,4-benzoquinol methylase